jgi:type IV secretory pathway VirB4 component
MANPSSKATQEFVPIQEIRDGIVILKNGSMRQIILAASLNFALKSADEQSAILLQFQNFLNSLDFSVQICIQSKKLDIRPYVALLEDRYKEQTSELMKIQVREYIEFIRTFVDSTNIMSKSFFIVVPYDPPLVSGGAGSALTSMLPGKKKGAGAGEGIKDGLIPEDKFQEYKSQIEQRAAVVEQGLVRCGIRTAELGTEEVVELFYKTFNPGETDKPIQLNHN